LTWIRISHGLRLDPIAGGSAEALVVLLHDRGQSAVTLTPVAARWAATVPMTAFVALDGLEQLDPPDDGFRWHTILDVDGGALPVVLDRAARHLEPLLEQQMHFWRLDAARVVLVGFGQGGTVALHLLLRCGWSCAGALAFSATPMRPLPRIIRVDGKVRLIESLENRDIDHAGLRDAVTSLVVRGVDARGVVLAGSALSDEAIRHGGAYLVELIATAQRGDRFHILDREISDAP
jgi:phospholipase/carboxylesterase